MALEAGGQLDGFEAALAALDVNDAAGRVTLAREAFDRKEYALSLKALDAAVVIDPLNRDARQLQNSINAQMQLDSQSRRDPTARPVESATTEPAAPPRLLRGLNPEQINRVRQLELRREDRVRIQFRNNVRKRSSA